jgi:hypothetical protein
MYPAYMQKAGRDHPCIFFINEYPVYFKRIAFKKAVVPESFISYGTIDNDKKQCYYSHSEYIYASFEPA